MKTTYSIQTWIYWFVKISNKLLLDAFSIFHHPQRASPFVVHLHRDCREYKYIYIYVCVSVANQRTTAGDLCTAARCTLLSPFSMKSFVLSPSFSGKVTHKYMYWCSHSKTLMRNPVLWSITPSHRSVSERKATRREVEYGYMVHCVRITKPAWYET